jgi:hypothetical protein
MTLTLALLSTASVFASSLAAYLASKAHARIDHLDISLNGRMTQLLQSTHAAGVVEGAVSGDVPAALSKQQAVIDTPPAFEVNDKPKT